MATMLYTYIRRHKAVELGTAANAAPASYRVKERSSTWPQDRVEKGRCDAKTASSGPSTRESSLDSSRGAISSPVTILPQYVATEATTLLMREDLIPYLPGSFTVWQGDRRVFIVDRERPSLTHRTNIVDTQTQERVMVVRKNICNFPVSFTFEDARSKKVVDLQGEFFVPCSGAKSTANMVNAETGSPTTLTMKGSYMNRHAVIKNAEGEVMVRMLSNVFEARNMVAHRRTYELKIQAGVDISLAVAMIVALHEREQQH